MNRFQRSDRPLSQTLVAVVLLSVLSALSSLTLLASPASAAESTQPGLHSDSRPAKPLSDRDGKQDEGDDEDEDEEGEYHHESDLHEDHEHDGSLQIPPLVIKPSGDDDEDHGTTGLANPNSGSTAGAAGFGRYEVGPLAGGPGNPLGGAVGSAPEGFAGFAPEGGTPVGHKPIDLRNVNFSQPTPADVFMQSATVALGVMGVGALALVGVTASRGKLLRRNPKPVADRIEYTSAD
jgi:hypothetical protein